MLKQPRYQKYRDSRNLFHVQTGTTNGVTLTQNEDGSYHVVGTAKGACFFRILGVGASASTTEGVDLASGAYACTTRIVGSVNGQVHIRLRDKSGAFGSNGFGYNSAGERTNTMNVTTSGTFEICVTDGTVVDCDVYVMVNSGASLPYEPYGVKIPDGIGEDADIVPFHSDHRPVEVSVGRKSRNLFDTTNYLSNLSLADVELVDNGDGTFTTYGTPTSTYKYAYKTIMLEPGDYWFSGSPSGGTSNSYCMIIVEYGEQSSKYIYETGNGIAFTVPKAGMYTVYFARVGGTIVSVDGLVWKPSIVKIEDKDYPYEPYGLNGIVTDPLYTPRLESKSGSAIEFTDSYNYECEVEIAGKSEQKQLSGKNLAKVYKTEAEATANGGIWCSGSSSISPTGDTLVVISSNLQLHMYKAVEKYIGKTVTFSFEVKVPESGTWQFYNYQQKGINISINRQFNEIVAGEWYKITASGIVNDTIDNPAYAKGTFILYMQGVSNSTFEVRNPQLELGSEATPYEPYCGGIHSPNPDYPQPIESIESVEIVSRGRNLLDPAKIRQAQYSGGIPVIPTWMTSKISFPFTGNQRTIGVGYVINAKNGETYTAYYLGDDEAAAVSYAVYEDETKIILNSNKIDWLDGGARRKTASYTATQDCTILFLFASWYYGDTIVTYNVEDCMIERGSASSKFEPYHAHTATIDLQGNKLRSLPDGTKDTLRVYRDGRVELVKRVGKFTTSAIDGRLDSSGKLMLVSYVSAKSVNDDSGRGLCDMFSVDSLVNTRSKGYGVITNYKKVLYCALGDKTASELKTFLESNPLTFMYPYETAETIQLPSIDPIPQFYPTTILDGNGNDITGYVTVVDNG